MTTRERLGDAFEYLLSVLGSQGDAGQFRTPRHIIDFIVEVVDPKKNETMLDPACGTAGFLISSYKHILKANTDAKGNSTLTPDEKGRLAKNFKGYDISPDMVRLSLVNLYLHGFHRSAHLRVRHAHLPGAVERIRRCDSGQSALHVAEGRASSPTTASPCSPNAAKCSLWITWPSTSRPTGAPASSFPKGIIFQSQSAYTRPAEDAGGRLVSSPSSPCRRVLQSLLGR